MTSASPAVAAPSTPLRATSESATSESATSESSASDFSTSDFSALDSSVRAGSFSGVLSLADDCLILGHRLSELCGSAPMLEEELATANAALDLLGHARGLYSLAGDLEGAGRDEDDFAYFRVERDFRNCLLSERPNGDFAETVLRLYYFGSFMALWWESACSSSVSALSGLSERAMRESSYHARHGSEWAVRLGGGTEESARRLSEARESLSPYLSELFEDSPSESSAVAEGILPSRSSLREAWESRRSEVESRSGLPPLALESVSSLRGGREGLHGESLGHLLCALQYLPRVYGKRSW